MVANVFTDVCTCVESDINRALDEVTSKVNKALQEKINEQLVLARAPLLDLPETALNATQAALTDVEQGLLDSVANGLAVDAGSTFAGTIRCVRNQIGSLVVDVFDATDARRIGRCLNRLARSALAQPPGEGGRGGMTSIGPWCCS